jgi:hypothetical protein
MMKRPRLGRFHLDEMSGLLMCISRPFGYWFLIKRGPFERGKNRPILWEADEGRTYVVCPLCREISKLDTSGMIINGRDLDSNRCIVCPNCYSRFWFSLIGWVDKETHRFMRNNPETCPFCKEHVTPSRCTVTYFMRQEHFYDRDFYFCCGFYWPKSSSASAPIEEAKS